LLPTVVWVCIHGNTIIRSGRSGDQKPQRKKAANPDNVSHGKTPLGGIVKIGSKRVIGLLVRFLHVRQGILSSC
jgi:hypothetical protein